jgi:hypothetical protein
MMIDVGKYCGATHLGGSLAGFVRYRCNGATHLVQLLISFAFGLHRYNLNQEMAYKIKQESNSRATKTLEALEKHLGPLREKKIHS